MGYPIIMNSKSRQRSIFIAWLPLAVMWVIMAIEQPGIAAVVARMSNAKLQLAAFGFTFSVALFIEGPIIQMLAAGTAIADNKENYKRLLRLMHVIGWSATAVHGLLCIPAVFTPFAQGFIGIPEELLKTSRLALIAMLPWTVGVGYRRLWQGVLIRYGKTAVIPITMGIRLGVSFLTLAWGLSTGKLPGAVLGGLALSLGVIAGAISAWIYVRPVLREMPKASKSVEDTGTGTNAVMGWSAMFLFYVPLALTNFINLGARPIMQMGLARGPLPLESLAIWPVTMGYVFLYSSFALSAQEIVIARLDGPESRDDLFRFISRLAAVLGIIYILVLATPLWRFWFSRVSGLTEDLTSLSALPVILSFPVIPLYAFISLFRGALVRSRRTREVTIGVAINVTVLLITLFVGVEVLPLPAISTVSGAYAMAYIAEFVFLASRRPLADFKE